MLPPCVENLLPREFPQAAVEAVRILRREGRDMEKDPVARPEMEVQPHRVGERPLRLDGRLPLREDGKPRARSSPASQGESPWGR